MTIVELVTRIIYKLTKDQKSPLKDEINKVFEILDGAYIVDTGGYRFTKDQLSYINSFLEIIKQFYPITYKEAFNYVSLMNMRITARIVGEGKIGKKIKRRPVITQPPMILPSPKRGQVPYVAPRGVPLLPGMSTQGYTGYQVSPATVGPMEIPSGIPGVGPGHIGPETPGTAFPIEIQRQVPGERVPIETRPAMPSSGVSPWQVANSIRF